MTVASSACRGGWAREKNTATCSSDPPIWAEFQLASLRALLASLLSPGRVRPPHLAQGLDLFRRGSQNFGTKIAEYCNHALLALEVLIHPRALPLIDFQSIDHHYSAEMSLPDNINSSGLRHDSSFRGGGGGMAGKRPNELDSSVDDLYESWFGNGETEALVTDHGKGVIHPGEPSGNSNNSLLEKVTEDLLLPDANDLEEDNPGSSAANDILVNNDKMMVDSHTPEPKEPEQHNRQGGNFMNAVSEHIAAESEKMVLGSSSAADAAMDVATAAESQVVATKVDVIDVSASGKDVAMTREDGCASILDTISAAISHTEENKGFTDGKDDESSAESLPDIVDGDPDSE